LRADLGLLMRWFLLIGALGMAFSAELDPREIVRRSVAAEEAADEKLADSYAYLERVETRQLAGDGSVKSVSSKTHEVMVIEGSLYRRLVTRDDEPLSIEEQRDQEEGLRKTIESRRDESASERAKRLEEYEKRRHKYRKAIREIPDAFIFRLAGEEMVNARPAYIIEVTPCPGYRPVDRYSKLFTELKGTLWIDKKDYRWVRVDAGLVDTVAFGWILVRIGKGARVKLQRERVNGEVWLPSRMWFLVSLRIGLIKGYHVEQETTFNRYRKFRANGDGSL
jgi:hypothetical protein